MTHHVTKEANRDLHPPKKKKQYKAGMMAALLCQAAIISIVLLSLSNIVFFSIDIHTATLDHTQFEVASIRWSTDNQS